MKTVLITGAGGFIARSVAARLTGEGYRVIGLGRTARRIPGYQAVYPCVLGDAMSRALSYEQFDAVVHTANAVGVDEYRVNVEGTSRWLQQAHEAGIPIQIFLSSLSSSPDALSAYGRAKYALERSFKEVGGVSLRLGVVIGDGGMYARMRDPLHAPLVPLLDGGKGNVHILGIDFLEQVIRDIVRDSAGDLAGGVWNLQQPEPHTLREVLTTIRRVHNLGCRFVSIPSLPVLWLLLALEKLPLSLPINSNNVRGLRQSRGQQFESHFERFGYPAESLEDLVTRAMRASAARATAAEPTDATHS